MPTLAGYQKSVTLLRPLAWYLGAVTLVRWIFQLAGLSPDGWYVYAVNVVTSVVLLYLHFQLQTSLYRIIQPVNPERARLIRIFRSVSAVVNTVMCFPIQLGQSPEMELLQSGIAFFATLGVGGTQAELFMSLRDIRAQSMAAPASLQKEEET